MISNNPIRLPVPQFFALKRNLRKFITKTLLNSWVHTVYRKLYTFNVFHLWFKNIVKVCQFLLSPANWICVGTLFYRSATLVVREHRPNHQQSTLRSTACPWTPHTKNWNSAPLHHPRPYPLLTEGVTWSSPLPRQSWHLQPTRRGAALSKNPVNRL